MNYREQFLSNLPDEPLKKTIGKIIVLFLFGFILSLILLFISFFVFKINLFSGENKSFLILLILQDLPFIILAILLFYRKISLKNIFSQLLINTSNKSIKMLLIFLLLDFLVAFILNFVTFGINTSPEKLKWLETYINSSPNTINLSYLILLLTSFLSFTVIAFCEEFIFRFTIYRYLRKHGFILAIISTSILFGILHGNTGFVSTFVFGIIVAIYYEYSNNFFGSVLLHILSNQFIVFYSYFLVYNLIR